MKVPIVDENDNVLLYKERDDIVFGDIFRITAIWITDEEGNILLAQRSLSKKTNPGKWGPAVVGTVEEGESYEENAYKELKEEIGVEGVPLKPVEKISYTSNTGKKFCYIFSLKIPKDSKLKIQEDEVNQVKWFSRDEFIDFIEKNPEEFVQAMIMFKDYMLKIK